MSSGESPYAVRVIQLGPLLAVVLGLFAATAAVLVWLGRLGPWHSILTASVRATVQLAAVSLLITAVLHSGWLTAAFVLMMFSVASITSARRFGSWSDAVWAAAAIAAGVAPPLAALILFLGGAMTATTLAGRRALDELKTRRGEYEAALALGFMPRDAALLICRPTAGQALVPALDQTRTVGLVTLPGAFVGVLLGGASPMQAGATQLVVLISLLLVEAVGVLVIVELIAAERVRRPLPSEPSAA